MRYRVLGVSIVVCVFSPDYHSFPPRPLSPSPRFHKKLWVDLLCIEVGGVKRRQQEVLMVLENDRGNVHGFPVSLVNLIKVSE